MKTGICFLLLLVLIPAYAQNKASQKAYKKAVAYFNKGNAAEGFASLQKSLQADSTNKKALYATGYYRFQARQYDSAQIAFDKLIRLYPNDTTFYHYRALTHLYTGHYEEAERDLKQAIALNATDENAWNDLGYLYYQWNQPLEAAIALDKSLSIRPGRTAWYYKALLAYAQNDRLHAKEYLQKSLQADPAYANALRLQANLLAEDQKYADAAQVYATLLKSGDIEDDDFLDWGLLYYRQKKYADALYYFTLPENPTDPNLRYYTGLTQYQLKNYADALQSLRQATAGLDSLDEDNAPILYDRAIVAFQAGNRTGARRDFFRAVYLMPEIVQQKNQEGDTLTLLGNAALLLNRLYQPGQLDSLQLAGYRDRVVAMLEENAADAQALEAANRAVRLDTANADSYFLRSRVHYLQGNYTQSLNDLNRVVALQKNKAGSYEHYWRGLVYSAMERYDDALRELDEAVRTDGQEVAYYADRALTLDALGQYEKALRDVNQAMQLETQDDKTYLTLIRASLLNDAGQYVQALADCEKVLAIQPANAVAYCMRGYAHKGLHQPTQAQADFTKALQLDPDLDEARNGLAGLNEQ